VNELLLAILLHIIACGLRVPIRVVHNTTTTTTNSQLNKKNKRIVAREAAPVPPHPIEVKHNEEE
jgi:hypothetical protein